MNYRDASIDDAAVLAGMNRQLTVAKAHKIFWRDVYDDPAVLESCWSGCGKKFLCDGRVWGDRLRRPVNF